MWRRTVLLATVLSFLAGVGMTAGGAAVWSDSRDDRAECIILRRDLDNMTYVYDWPTPTKAYTESEIDADRRRYKSVVERYNDLCR